MGGYVKNLVRTPCNAEGKINVYVEAAISVAIISLWDLVSPSCGGIMRSKIGKPDFGHRRFKSFLAKSVGTSGSGPTAIATKIWFGSLLAPVLRLDWYWLVAATLGNAAIDWTSIVYAEQGCPLPGTYCTDVPIGTFVYDGSAPGNLVFLGSSLAQCCSVGFNTINVPLGCEVTITYNAQFNAHDPARPNASATVWIEDNQGNVYGSQTSVKPSDPNIGDRAAGMAINIGGGTQLGGRNLAIKITTSGGPVACLSGVVNITAHGHEIPVFSLPDCFKTRDRPKNRQVL